MRMRRMRYYFTDLTVEKGIFYSVAVLYVVAASTIVMIEPYMAIQCRTYVAGDENESKFGNPAYDANPCRTTRLPQLLGLNIEECMFGRRLVVSVLLGGIIGWERRQADRPAGIRTMALVSLGSALFTICSAYAFLSGPMEWDASRISAAIPSGVGFLGSALIFKQSAKDQSGQEGAHVVHGLTTAASVWLSAAVGIACGGGLYFIASFCCALMLVLLRFGPRYRDFGDGDESEEECEEGAASPMQHVRPYASIEDGRRREDPEVQSLIQRSESKMSQRSLRSSPKKRPQLSS